MKGRELLLKTKEGVGMVGNTLMKKISVYSFKNKGGCFLERLLFEERCGYND